MHYGIGLFLNGGPLLLCGIQSMSKVKNNSLITMPIRGLRGPLNHARTRPRAPALDWTRTWIYILYPHPPRPAQVVPATAPHLHKFFRPAATRKTY